MIIMLLSPRKKNVVKTRAKNYSDIRSHSHPFPSICSHSQSIPSHSHPFAPIPIYSQSFSTIPNPFPSIRSHSQSIPIHSQPFPIHSGPFLAIHSHSWSFPIHSQIPSHSNALEWVFYPLINIHPLIFISR
jgi:hypothetical protein